MKKRYKGLHIIHYNNKYSKLFSNNRLYIHIYKYLL